MMELKAENLPSHRPDTEMSMLQNSRRNLPSLVSEVQVGETSTNSLDDLRDQVKLFKPRFHMLFCIHF